MSSSVFRFGTGGVLNRMRTQAKELPGLDPDVIVAESTPAAVALRHETAAVPNRVLAGGESDRQRPGREPGMSR
jgi:hypothetical protein